MGINTTGTAAEGNSQEGVTKFTGLQIGLSPVDLNAQGGFAYYPTGVNSVYTGTPIWSASAISFAGPARVVQGSASSFSVIPWPAARPQDFLMIAPFGGGVSSLSSGLVLHSHCTQAGQVEVRWSNVSTLAQNQSAITYVMARFQFWL